MDTVQRAYRTYTRDFTIGIVAYGVLVIFVEIFVDHAAVSPVWRAVLAVLPVLPIAFAVRAFVRYLRGTDELQRQIQLESLAIAFGGSALAAQAYGLLEYAGLPHLNPIWLYALMITLWGVASTFTSRRYR